MAPSCQKVKPIAIIPARGNSKRLPRKNIMLLNNKPLIVHVIDMLKVTGIFSDIIVSSENKEIKAIANSEGVTVIDRPDELAQDRATMFDVCKHVVQSMDIPSSTWVCMLYATAVLLKVETLKKSYSELKDNIETDSHLDSLMGVSYYQLSPYQALIENNNGYLQYAFAEYKNLQSQFLPKAVVSNGTFLWCHSSLLKKDNNFYTDHLKGFLVPNDEVCDIDYLEDFNRLERMMNCRC